MSELQSAVKNAADKEQVSEARKDEVTSRETELNDFRTVISTPAGRRFVAKFLRRTGVFEDTYCDDQYFGARLDGIRWVGLQLLEDVKAVDPTVLLEAIQTYMDEEKNESTTRKRSKRKKR